MRWRRPAAWRFASSEPSCRPSQAPITGYYNRGWLCVGRRCVLADCTLLAPHRRICVLAGDISPIDVITHIPIVCEDHKIQYIYVPSKEVSQPGFAGAQAASSPSAGCTVQPAKQSCSASSRPLAARRESGKLKQPDPKLGLHMAL